MPLCTRLEISSNAQLTGVDGVPSTGAAVATPGMRPGGVRTSLMLFRTDERDAVHTVLCDHAGEPVDESYTLCTLCNKVHLDGWREIEEIVTARSACGRQNPPVIRHGICESCHHRIDHQLGAAH